MQFLTLAVTFQEILKNFLGNCKALNVFYCTLFLNIGITIINGLMQYISGYNFCLNETSFTLLQCVGILIMQYRAE